MKGLPALLLVAAVLASGCASTVYAPANRELDDPSTEGCDTQALEDALVKSCRRLGGSLAVPSAPPFVGVTRRTATADPYKLEEKPSLLAQALWEFTPLGFFSPLFGYPPRTTVYAGRVKGEIALPSGDKIPADFEFRVNAGEEFTTVLRPAPRVNAAVRCRARGCSLTLD